MVGLLDDVDARVGPAFAAAGDAVCLVGESTPGLAGSAYAALAGGASEDGPPSVDLAREARGAGDSSARRWPGGSSRPPRTSRAAAWPTALAEAAIWGGLGARVRVPVAGSPAVELFGESPSRLVVTSRARHAPALELLARQLRPAGRADRRRSAATAS